MAFWSLVKSRESFSHPSLDGEALTLAIGDPTHFPLPRHQSSELAAAS